MLPGYFIYVGIVINTIGTLGYIVDAIRGKIKSNKVTYLLWSLSPLQFKIGKRYT